MIEEKSEDNNQITQAAPQILNKNLETKNSIKETQFEEEELKELEKN